MEELNLPYELVKVDEVKGEKFLAVNPNGRVPALTDANTGVTTWEVGHLFSRIHFERFLTLPVWLVHRISHRNIRQEQRIVLRHFSREVRAEQFLLLPNERPGSIFWTESLVSYTCHVMQV